MSDKSMEMPVRVASLEYLGLVAARLRRDSVQSRAKLATMDAVVRDIRAEEEKDGNQTQVCLFLGFSTKMVNIEHSCCDFVINTIGNK
jgi:hypothetical protein